MRLCNKWFSKSYFNDGNMMVFYETLLFNIILSAPKEIYYMNEVFQLFGYVFNVRLKKLPTKNKINGSFENMAKHLL